AYLRADLGTATLFISHNLGIVARLCDRVGVLYAGRLVEEGPTSTILSESRHPYTIGLMNSVPKWGSTKETNRLQPVPGDLPLLGESQPGCGFAPRCSISQSECESTPPPLETCATSESRSACLYRDSLPERFAAAPALEATPVAIGRRESREETAPAVVVSNVVKKFKAGGGDITVLNDISLTINAGEILGLVGESGSGKTTFARTIAGLYPTDGGSILSGGEAHRSQSGQAHFLQMVFQNPDTALNPSKSIARILGRAVKRLGPPMSASEREKRVLELANSVKLQGYHLQMRPSALSGGLKQRVAIGRAFAGNPSVVLLDEPASALDVSVQATILNLLVDLQHEHDLAYLLISHDLAVVNYLSDRIAVMYLGEIVEVGPSRAVIAPPHHPYTEALLSANSAANSTAGERIRLVGQMPSVANPPTGCRFHTRCPRSLGDRCRDEVPKYQTTPDGHSYKCHIEPDELRRVQLAAPRTTQSADEGAAVS
ncbi:MAG: ABC transporter ATP-binding protein, partial [Acidobacteria bacterium]|nr:ABC transporter ATP-binding protein [Acidobacteriota bacterium]